MFRLLPNPLFPGDIVSFRFPHSEGMAPYARPCLVLDASDKEVLLAYGTTSRSRANVGFELRVTAEFAECGLDKASRFVLARRVRVARADPRLVPNALGTPVLGRLTEALRRRQNDLFAQIEASWPTAERRIEAERRGLHPRRGDRRRRGGEPYLV
ncbi:hypothetical protein [Thioclava electrotropha]|uniref:Type II toxin-antitoxin system PemK/MazF family toxin n=1 Tax=Thioclava electrotropha TaxID=1549850 RepID=A0ABX6YZU8_9RHOB|nr:hypothetical protein [Thioclava electrotropha]QPZ93394.1 hypothetical protein AKL02_020685 [Thioclava electrotropha]